MSEKAEVINEIERRIEYEIKRREASQDLGAFILFTTPSYKMGWVHREICDALNQFLQDIADCKSPRLIITVPPRHGKSQIVSRALPAYALGRNPDLQIISCSYSADLTKRFSRDVQRYMLDAPYHEVFPDTNLPGKFDGRYTRTAEFFEIAEHKGSYRAAGVGGGITGMGADCLTESAQILTPYGFTSIKNILTGMPVISYNIEKNQTEISIVEAIQVKYGEYSIIEINSNRGRSLQVTEGHPIFTGTKYEKADYVTAGSELLCSVWQGNNPKGIRVAQMGDPMQRQAFLLSRLRSKIRVSKQCSKALLRNVRRSRRQTAKVLPGLLRASQKMALRENGLSGARKNLPELRQKLFSGSPRSRKICSILLNGMQKCRTFKKNEWRWQPEIQGRYTSNQSIQHVCAELLSFEKIHSQTGSFCLRSLSQQRTHFRASCRFKPSQRHETKCMCFMSEMSCRSAQARNSKDIRTEYVTSVKRIPSKDRIVVYDLQVSGNHNFFANGILVHNCLIIDDAVKDRAAASSASIRDSTWDWYTSTAYTRLSEGGGVIVMMTRWHQDDLVGRLLARSQEKWKVINYPAIAEYDEPHRKAGEALHPERYSLATLLARKAEVGSRDWASLFQQHPVPDGGSIFKDTWIRRYAPSSLPLRFDRMVASWDCTFKDTDGSDFVVGQVWGKAGANYYLLDQVRGRWDFVKTLEMVQLLAEKHPNATKKLIEDKANGSAIIQTLKKTVSGIKPITPKESKEARAFAVTPLWEAGNVFIPDASFAPWVSDFEAEILSFPSAAHDDQVDAMTQALNELKTNFSRMSKSNMAFLRMNR